MPLLLAAVLLIRWCSSRQRTVDIIIIISCGGGVAMPMWAVG
jgi:hypothetical protein